jgi:hypothetical protein
MALKAKLPNLNGLPEAIQALYRQEGETFILDVEPADGFALEDVTNLKSALGRQKTEIDSLKTKVASFGDIDPDKAKTALKKLEELGTLDPAELAKERIKVAIQQQQEQFNTQLSAKDQELNTLTQHLTTVMVDQAATAALAAKGGNVRLLLPHVKSMARVVKGDDGKFGVQVVDGAGHPRIVASKNGTTNMTLEELVAEMSASQDFAAAFTSQSRSGGGSNPTLNGGGNGRLKTIDANDQNAINGSIEDIAAGKTELAFTG